jgi:hypothetical protein
VSNGCRLRLGIAMLIAAMLAPATALAVTVQELQQSGRLSIKSSVQPGAGVVPGQKVSLVLEVATDRWFTGGTRIEIPEVAGLVILQSEQFATNSSERRQGQNWVLQRWLLDVFPQREGEFRIGPVAVKVRVNDEQAGEVSGTLRSPPVSFSVTRPAALAQAGQWVAAPDYQVTQTFDRSLEQLQVGDAFEREVVFRASDVMAMMLPGLDAEDLSGLAAYSMPPALENSNNRGVATATRVERISYVVQVPGTYQLPVREYFWWDTNSKTVKLLTLPAVDISVTAAADTPAGLRQRARDLNWKQAAWSATAVVLAFLLFILLRRLPGLPRKRLRAPFTQLAAHWRELRRPALPTELNPGSSVGD